MLTLRLSPVCFLGVFLASFLCTQAHPESILNLTQAEVIPSGKSKGKDIQLPATAQGPIRFQPTDNRWADSALRLKLPDGLESRTTYELKLELRSPSKDGEAGQAGVLISLGQPDAEKPRSLKHKQFETTAIAAGEWQTFSEAFTLPNKLSSDTVLDLQISFFREPLEIRQLQLIRHPQGVTPADLQRGGSHYPGQEPDAAWRKAAQERIKKHRKADLNIRVVDNLGKPVPGAKIQAEMQRHAYLFGTCIKAARIVDAQFKPWKPKEFNREQWLADNKIYREKIKELFNFIVFENDLKWLQWTGERGLPNNQQNVLNALTWLKKNNIVAKSHTMVWGSWQFVPTALKRFENEPRQLQAAILDHIQDVGGAIAGQVAYADVLNEPLAHTEILDLLTTKDIAAWFEMSRQTMPGTKLVLNDFDLIGNGGSKRKQEKFIELVKQLDALNAPVDMIGFQAHFWSPRLTPLERMLEIIDRFAALGKPLMVSEFDMNIPNEQLQADYTRDFLTVWFSHPSTQAYIMWGFWAKAHWMRERGAMYRGDWSPKLNAAAYQKLVFEDWWTKESLTTDAEGLASFRGFKGDYRITLSAPGKETVERNIRLTSDTSPGTLTVILYPEDTKK